jgi:immunity protein 26 of polymorphic toxin system
VVVTSKQDAIVVNLTVLKKSRRPPQAGDIFVMLPPDGLYLYGRVISTDAKAGFGMPGCNLIYVYKARYKEKRPIPELLPEELLIPPIMTNRLPWTKGYLEFLENRPLTDADRFPQHCFVDNYVHCGRYYDEYCNQLSGPVGSVGEWGLDSYRTIDDQISKALGIPRAPD